MFSRDAAGACRLLIIGLGLILILGTGIGPYAAFAQSPPAELTENVSIEDRERLCPLVSRELASKAAQAIKGMARCETQCSGCGCKGGPGYRSKATKKCVGWADIISACGPPPHEGCTRECEPVVAGCTGGAWVKALAAKLGMAVQFLPGQEREKAGRRTGGSNRNDGGAGTPQPDAETPGKPLPAAAIGGVGVAECGTKRTCGEMASCAEARHYLINCHVTRLDRDGDGVPCNSLCKGR